MAGFFSRTAYDRLPVAVRKMPKKAQTVCIYLRLRKNTERIEREMGISAQEAQYLVNEVRRTLIVSGNYDMIADPVFVSLDEVGENGRRMEPAATDGSPEDRLLVKSFLSALEDSISRLAAPERRILHLFFERQMTGSQIFDFYRKSGLALDPKKGSGPKSGSDVFYFIEKSLKKLLSSMAQSTPIGRGTLTVKGLKEILAQTGVEEVA